MKFKRGRGKNEWKGEKSPRGICEVQTPRNKQFSVNEIATKRERKMTIPIVRVFGYQLN